MLSSVAHLHHDLPQLLPFVQALERRSRLLEREDAVHDRPQLATRQQPDDLPVLRVVPHRRTQDAPPIPETPPQADPHLATGPRAAPPHPAAAPAPPPPPLPRR